MEITPWSVLCLCARKETTQALYQNVVDGALGNDRVWSLMVFFHANSEELNFLLYLLNQSCSIGCGTVLHDDFP